MAEPTGAVLAAHGLGIAGGEVVLDVIVGDLLVRELPDQVLSVRAPVGPAGVRAVLVRQLEYLVSLARVAVRASGEPVSSPALRSQASNGTVCGLSYPAYGILLEGHHGR